MKKKIKNLRRDSKRKKMTKKNRINIGISTKTHEILKELQHDCDFKSFDDVIRYLLEK